ncbi:MAG: A/G-specific adenine glycosylase [Lentisphaerae bacterium]|nr:MAG: A/G-specific adenine glycosylase [Lentisphaerota bacterium]
MKSLPHHEIAQKLGHWYLQRRRPMPWHDASPYHIWISEIMLQQTQVETVIPYFNRFIRHFPDLPSLAAAAMDDILQLWEGLGYYRRARFLHACANQLLQQYHPKWPQTAEEWKKLPGIGDYTAAAIASIAFADPVPVLDGNVMRLCSRILTLPTPPTTTQARNTIRQYLTEHYFSPPPIHPGVLNQAFMETGATICRPRSPQCESCPLRTICRAHLLAATEAYPVIPTRQTIPQHTVALAVTLSRKKNHILLQKRPSSGMLPGLWELPGGKVHGRPHRQQLIAKIREQTSIPVILTRKLGSISHTYSHFRIQAHIYLAEAATEAQPTPQGSIVKTEWAPIAKLDTYPMGKVARRALDRFLSTS